MAKKTSANQGSSGEQERGTPRVSRKVIGKASAPYERKAGAEGGEEKKPGSEGEQAAAADQAESKPAPEAASAEAAPDQGKSEPARTSARKESASRREARATDRAESPAAEAVSAAEKSEKPEKSEPAPAAAEAAPAPAAAAPAPAAPPPVPQADPAAEFEVLLKPREIERWDPATPAPPPRKAPPGDSRSFRRRNEGVDEFVLIYRVGSFLIRRAGRVGVMGTWTVTEYPHIGSAAHAYAQQCSDLTYAGFRDLR